MKQIFNPFLVKRFQSIGGASTPSNTDITNTLIVTKGGDDANALAAGKYDSHTPWLNPSVAMANAVAGDMVVVFPGEYIIGPGGYPDNNLQYIVRDNITLYMMPGANISYTGPSSHSLPFYDGFVRSTFIIRGKGNFSFSGSSGWSLLVTRNADSVVDWEFDTLTTGPRLGGSGHDCAFWRLVGRKFITSSTFGTFRFPVKCENRIIIIDVEEAIVLPARTLHRIELNNFNNGSTANISLGRVEYPYTYPGNGFLHITSADSTSTINFHCSSITRGDNTTVRDSVCYSGVNSSRGTVEFNNISTPTLIYYHNNSNKTLRRRIEKYTGIVVDSAVAPMTESVAWVGVANSTDIHLDVTVATRSQLVSAFHTTHETDAVISGKINYLNPVSKGVIQIKAPSFLPTITLKDLEINTMVGYNIPSVKNIGFSDVTMRIINTFATTAIDVSQAPITQLIQTIQVNPNV